MEGLLIAEVVAELQPLLPNEPLGFRFLDAHTSVLPLAGAPSLWLFDRPPNPRIELRPGAPAAARAHTGFQEQLLARAGGPLVAVEQRKLDRVVSLRFGAGKGFVASAPAELIVELTGRNCNLILTDPDGTILGAAREIDASVNRFRQVRPGLRYEPPPPYDKLDPRHAARADLGAALHGKKLKNLRKVVDGVGPELTKALSALARVAPDAPLEGEALERTLDALARLVADPSATLRAALGLPDVATLRRRERRGELLERARALLGKELALADKRIDDARRTIAAADEAAVMRSEADLLMAYSARVPDHAADATLPGFDGEPVALALDPRLSAVGNAEARYRKARKRELRAEKAIDREDELQRERERLAERLAELEALEMDALEALVAELEPRRSARGRRGPGVRYRAPHGFTVVVGRSARENDEITFRLAKSRDLWLHVQAYHGAHVVVQANNQEIPFETVLFAAKLAAGYSKAANSDNVPVDYTLKKNVWKVKGMPAGAVHFSQQKTVYVTPDRHPPGGEVLEH